MKSIGLALCLAVARVSAQATVPGTYAIAVCKSAPCVPSDSEHAIDESYYLAATDISAQMSLYRRVDKSTGIARVEPTVFAVGWDTHHLIVKRHPNNDRSKTEYFILDRAKDASPLTDPSVSVTGPFSAEQFSDARRRAGVAPELGFALVLNDLQ